MAQWNTCRTFKWWFLPQKEIRKRSLVEFPVFHSLLFETGVTDENPIKLWWNTFRPPSKTTVKDDIQTTIKDYIQTTIKEHHPRDKPSSKLEVERKIFHQSVLCTSLKFEVGDNQTMESNTTVFISQVLDICTFFMFVFFSNKTSSASAPLWNWKQAGDDHSFNNELTKRGKLQLDITNKQDVLHWNV